MFTSTPNTYTETRHTHNTNIHTSDFSLWTKSASPCRELLPETRIRTKEGNGRMKSGTWGERGFVHAIMLLMVRRILTGSRGCLKGICKFTPKCTCRWQDVFGVAFVYVLLLHPVLMYTESGSLWEWVKHDSLYCACWVTVIKNTGKFLTFKVF